MPRRVMMASIVALASLLSASPSFSQGAPGIDARALLHDTRNLSYRAPFGAVPVGTAVRLRLRTAHSGASSVSLLLIRKDASSRTLATSTYKLARSSQSGRYDRWQVTLKP